jgi:hypothetical protein
MPLESKVTEDFELFLEALRRATRSLDSHYFQMPVAELQEPIYRERVYCYELYHQLRCVLPGDFPYVLAGETDKSGHPIIHKAIGPYKPDLIVHQPGNMAANLAVVEVKPMNTATAQFKEDLDHLTLFLSEADYFGAIALVYGQANDERQRLFAAEFERTFEGLADKRAMSIWHEGPGQPCRIIHSIP